ncbi:hypothetical protein [Streptomyces bottropensis]|uniref:hypothetical protein n=1 Tax=Streptomyces bottropensis TaxID=42235 RepID=UPI003D15F00B
MHPSPPVDASRPASVTPSVTDLAWTELDQRAVDTARILAADAVQKVGNGHPGTAMSLAPAAYTLFQGERSAAVRQGACRGRGRYRTDLAQVRR